MKFRYRNEDEMKDSGVEWIGAIPIEWRCINFSRGVTLKQGLQIAQSDRFHEAGKGRYIYITVKYMNSHKNEYDTEYILNPDEGVMCNKDDVLLARTGSTGKVVTNIEGVFHNNFFKIRYNKSKIVKRYLVYYLTQTNVQEHLKLVAGTTTIPDLNHGDFLATKFVLPNKNAQEKTANFLDEKTGKLDTIISKKQDLIKILEEAKKSLISEVVTGKVKVVKILNEYELVERKKEEMKDSGVEWLADVPNEWFIFRSKYLWKKEKREVKEEYGVVTAFRDGDVTLRENKRAGGFTFAIKEIGYQGVLKGDLVISAMDAFAGAMGISDSEGKCSPVYSICSPLIKVVPKYYKYLLKEMSQKGYILSLAKGIRERSTDFRYTDFANTFLLYPNIFEQEFISELLDNRMMEMNSIIEKMRFQIQKIKEAKQSLISKAVTGKIEILD